MRLCAHLRLQLLSMHTLRGCSGGGPLLVLEALRGGGLLGLELLLAHRGRLLVAQLGLLLAPLGILFGLLLQGVRDGRDGRRRVLVDAVDREVGRLLDDGRELRGRGRGDGVGEDVGRGGGERREGRDPRRVQRRLLLLGVVEEVAARAAAAVVVLVGELGEGGLEQTAVLSFAERPRDVRVMVRRVVLGVVLAGPLQEGDRRRLELRVVLLEPLAGL